jgi:putative flavoprotein involved in K+ transport
MAERIEVVVVGAGQAGLAVSHELKEAGVEHVVLERSRVAESWRARWDSFCLVTPNWSVLLPGGAYAGEEPDGFMRRDQVVAHLERYAAGFSAPVRQGVEVTSIARSAEGGFLLSTPGGDISANAVVLCTGAYQKPHRPAAAAGLPEEQYAVDAEGYSNPGALPPGRVLVVGSGQTGCQLAEELREAGREVFLACGRAPWLPRFIDGRDFVTWMLEIGFFENTPSVFPNPATRLVANVQATGHGGGHDLHYRTLAAMGVNLLGRLAGIEDGTARFASDLADSVAFGDSRYRDLRDQIHKGCVERGLRAPEMPDPDPFRYESRDSLSLGHLGAVIFTSGFRPDYQGWVRFPEAFDELGFPIHQDCASTAVPGLYFAGVHFLRKRKSSLLLGVGEDAGLVARRIAERMGAAVQPDNG